MNKHIKGKNKNNSTKLQKPVKILPETAKPQKEKILNDFILKIFIFSAIIIGVVWMTDSLGVFNPDYTNDHTRRKWNTFYKQSKELPVDVLLVGNSHLYTGISPENLSNALGATSFILASPGTTMTDVYFALKEGISFCKPSIAIVETFCINDYDSHKLQKGTLSDQFKSFSARKNITQKLLSTPILFASDNYVAAWSNTIRNHNFIFDDTAQIRKNIELINHPLPQPNGLYLGRYIRFTSGLEDSTLKKYNNPNSGYDYWKHRASDEAKQYMKKIIELCNEHHIKLVFVTLPMYYKHVRNYAAYKEDLLKTINDPQQLWLDMQQPYDTVAFTPDCFENTVSENQHITYYGSCVAAYKLAAYIKTNLKLSLPNRYTETWWKQAFYASDGYFENYSPENDGISQIIPIKTVKNSGFKIEEVVVVPSMGGKKVIVKMDKNTTPTMFGRTLKLQLTVSMQSQSIQTVLPLKCTCQYNTEKYYVFESQPISSDIQVSNLNILEN